MARLYWHGDVPGSYPEIDDHPDGSLTDPKQQAGIEALGKTLASFLMKLKV